MLRIILRFNPDYPKIRVILFKQENLFGAKPPRFLKKGEIKNV
jgi:hypothetical protein